MAAKRVYTCDKSVRPRLNFHVVRWKWHPRSRGARRRGARARRKTMSARCTSSACRQRLAEKQRSVAITSGFDTVYEHDLWADGGEGGGSGPGSSINATRTVSALLVHLILAYQVNSLLDAPCGAMVWMPGVLEAADSLRAVPGLVGRDQSTPPPLREVVLPRRPPPSTE